MRERRTDKHQQADASSQACGDAPTGAETAPQPDHLFSIFDRLSTAIWIFDFDCKRVLWANTAGLAAWNAESAEDLYARDLAPDMSDTVKKRLEQYKADFARKDVTFSEIWTLYPKGKPQTMKLQMRGFVLPDGRMSLLCEGMIDHELHPETLRSTEALLHTPVIITLVTEDGTPLYRNPASRTSCLTLESNFFDQFTGNDERESFRENLKTKDHLRSVARILTSSGERWHEITARSCLDAATGVPAYLISEIDVTELHETKERAQHHATHDSLTELPNRTFVNAKLPELLSASQVSGEQLHLFLIDLDGFKSVNDTRGHAAGDALLQVFAVHLRGLLNTTHRSEDFAARLGGDEFLICLQDMGCTRDPDAIGHRLLSALAEPVMVDGELQKIDFSIGHISLPVDALNLDEAMRHADQALYRAKGSATNKCVSYRSIKNGSALKALQL